MGAPYTAAAREFPDYPASDLPPMPEGFTDASWHNDGAPAIQCDARRLRVWMDYADPDQREVPGSRFLVHRLDADGAFLTDSADLETDDWSEVLAFIENAKTYA